jgi:hypothetical protein
MRTGPELPMAGVPQLSFLGLDDERETAGSRPPRVRKKASKAKKKKKSKKSRKR